MKPVEGERPSENVGDARCLAWGSKSRILVSFEVECS